jgi:hypothetical protein
MKFVQDDRASLDPVFGVFTTDQAFWLCSLGCASIFGGCCFCFSKCHARQKKINKEYGFMTESERTNELLEEINKKLGKK